MNTMDFNKAISILGLNINYTDEFAVKKEYFKKNSTDKIVKKIIK